MLERPDQQHQRTRELLGPVCRGEEEEKVKGIQLMPLGRRNALCVDGATSWG